MIIIRMDLQNTQNGGRAEGYAELKVQHEFELSITPGDQIRPVTDRSFVKATSSNDGLSFKYIDVNGIVLAALPQAIKRVREFIVVSPSQVIILARGDEDEFSRLIIWNFWGREPFVTQLHLESEKTKVRAEGILFFNDSSIICYWQNFSSTPKIRVAYFRLCEVKFGIVLHQCVCKLPRPYYNYQVAKLNQQSMIGFFSQDLQIKKGIMTVSVYSLNSNNQGEALSLQIDVSEVMEGSQFNSDMDCNVLDIWEFNPGQFYFHIEVEINKFRGGDFKKFFKKYRFCYNLHEKRVRKINLNIGLSDSLQFINAIRPVKQTTEIKGRIFRSLYEPRQLSVEIHYVNPRKVQLLLTNFGVENIQASKYVWFDYASDKMFKICQDKTREVAKVTVYKFPEWSFAQYYGLRIISVSWMTELMEGTNDDLVEMVYNLLD